MQSKKKRFLIEREPSALGSLLFCGVNSGQGELDELNT